MMVCMAFSPPKRKRAASPVRAIAAPQRSSDRAPERLILGAFRGSVLLEFGQVVVGSQASRTFVVELPRDARQAIARLVLQPIADDDVLAVDFAALELTRGESRTAVVTWTPLEAGKFKGAIHFELDDRFRVQATVVGEAIGGKRRTNGGENASLGKENLDAENGASGASAKDSAARRRAMLEFSARSRKVLAAKSANAGAKSSSSTTITATAAAAGSTHSQSQQPPAAASASADTGAKAALLRKAMRDDDWAAKQATAFAAWLTHTIAAAPDAGAEESGDAETCRGGATPLKEMYAMRRAAQVRRRASLLFHGNEITTLAASVRAKLADGTLAPRMDRVLHVDVGLREAMTDLLMSYDACWLHLALETVFGELVPLPDDRADSRRSDAALRLFVRERLLKDPALRKRFAGRCNGPSERLYHEALGQHALEHCFLIVLFLDRAKREDLLPKRTCLFRKSTATAGNAAGGRSSGRVTSSEDVLRGLCQFLRGEGDIVRHLAKMGFVVTYRQTFTDEFDYAIKNLATDLRDGVRLTRLAEVLRGREAGAGAFPEKQTRRRGGAATSGSSSSTSLVAMLRVPAVSRLQKVHNTEFALTHLARGGALATLVAEAAAVASGSGATFCAAGAADGLPAIARRVVDGCERTTLQVLWALISRHQLTSLVDPPSLLAEVCEIIEAWNWRADNGEDSASAALGRKTLPMPDVAALADATAGATSMEAALPAVLLGWAQAVCHGYGVPVRNFTTSFADGRALCLLLHYYHPQMLPLAAIRTTTAHLPRRAGVLPQQQNNADGDLADFLETIDPQKATDAACRAVLEGERANADAARRCMRELGGVPPLLPQFDSLKRPEEKTVLVTVAYLCHRLVDSAADVRAAIRIQRFWRNVLCETGRGDLVLRAYYAQNSDDAISSVGSEDVNHQRADPHTPVMARRKVSSPPKPAAAPLGLRCMVRHGRSAPPPMVKLLLTARQTRQDAVKRLISWWRQSSAKIAHRRRMTGVRRLQALARGAAARCVVLPLLAEARMLRAEAAAAMTLQAWLRGRLQRRSFVALRRQQAAVVVVQSVARMNVAARRYRRLVQATIAAQRLRRQYVAERDAYAARAAAATYIQAVWRGRSCEVDLQRLKAAVLRLQNAWRRVVLASALSKAANVEKEKKQAKLLALRAAAMCAAAVAIQTVARSAAARRTLEGLRTSALALRLAEEAQAAAAAAAAAAESKRVLAAVALQTAWRGKRELSAFTAMRQATVKLQAAARGRAARAEAASARRAVVALQALERARIARREAAALRQKAREEAAAVILQAFARAASARQCLAGLRKVATESAAATAVQTAWRRKRAHSGFLNQLRSVVALQALARRFLAKKFTCEQRLALQQRREDGAAIALQTRWRCWSAQSFYTAQRNAAVTLQSLIRRQLAVRAAAAAASSAKERCQAAALLLQANYRAHRATVLAEERKRAVRQCQALARGWHVRRQLAAEATAAIVVQAAYRGAQARFAYRGAQNAALVLQAGGRGMMVRRHLQKQRAAAIVVQSIWRGMLAQKRAALLLAAAKAIGAWALARRARVQFTTMRAAAVVLQLWAHRIAQRKALTEALNLRIYQRGAASTLQRAWRHKLLQKAAEAAARENAARALQKLWRRWQQRCVQQSSTTLATIRLQAFARACAVRSAAGPDVAVARTRLRVAGRRARANPADTLGRRVEDALWVLRHSTRLTEVVRACMTLELSTRYSRVCCQVVAEGEAPAALTDLLAGLNRSPPHQRILKSALCTFRNVARHGGKLAALAAAPPHLPGVLLDVMQTSREHSDVFVPAARLLAALAAAHGPTRRTCGQAAERQRLAGMEQLLRRRAAAETRAGLGSGRGVCGKGSAQSLRAMEGLTKALRWGQPGRQ